MFRFEIVSPQFDCKTFELPDGVFRVGRGDHNQIVIKHKTVSREHCEFHLYWPEAIVRECGSHNGVFVDGDRVSGQVGLKHGQTIRIGQIQIRIRLAEAFDSHNSAHSAMDALRVFERECKDEEESRVSFPLVLRPSKDGTR